jgi:predicted SprT family Zn-dependent metalloprotease
MLEFILKPAKNPKQKEELYELACECTTVRLNEKEASRIIEEMTVCKGCKKPVFLVI